MIDRLFTAALAFCLLAGGTAAIGSAWFDSPAPAARAAQPTVVHLPPVEVRIVRLPAVEVTASRTASTAVARTERTEPATREVQ